MKCIIIAEDAINTKLKNLYALVCWSFNLKCSCLS